MTQDKKSLRSRHAEKRAKEQRQRRITYGSIAFIAIAAFSFLLWSRRFVIQYPDPIEVPEGANGMAWGPADAQVLIQEYSDFQ